jgi:hypothetical protein
MPQPRYNPTTNQMVRVDTDNPAVQHSRQRVTLAQLNAGFTLLAAVPGFAYRLVDITLIAIGGAVAGATDVRILGTRAAGSVALGIAAVAGLTQSTLLRLGSPFATAGTASIVALADGASLTPLDANTAVTIGKTGGTATTATAVDVILTYALE